MTKRITAFILCACMMLWVTALPSSAETYWSAQAAYIEAIGIGDGNAIISAVKRIEAVYPTPSDLTEHQRLATPRINAAAAYEKMGKFPEAAEYYRKALYNIEQIRALEDSDVYFDYLNTLTSLIRHNDNVPTVYAETSDTDNIPYYGAAGEDAAGTRQGMCLEYGYDYDPAFHSAHLLYVQFFSEDIKDFSWLLPSNTDDYLLLVAWNLPEENKTDLDRVNSGEYDEYIIRNLQYLSTLDCDVLIRFGAEVNCWSSLPPLDGSDKAPAHDFIKSYKDAFKRVASLADTYSPKAGMVYSPNSVSNWYYTVEDFYPGDRWVDWVGISAYYNKTAGDDWKPSSGNDAFYCRGDYYDDPITKIEHIVNAFADRKPIIITEGGCSYKSSDGVQSVEYAAEKLSYFYTYVSRVYPQIKAVMYFNASPSSNSYKLFGRTGACAELADLYTALVRSNAAMEYVHGNSEVCGYTEITNIDEITSELALSVYASYPSTEAVSVSYSFDGRELLESDEYPYEVKIPVEGLSIGGHFLKVQTSCMETVTKQYYKVNVDETGKVTVSEAIPAEITDVPRKYWGCEAIAFGLSRDLFKGTSSDEFSPLGDVSRAMFVTILARLSGYNADDYNVTSFEDVESGRWYSAAVEWARVHGIVKGTGDTAFSPNDPISRQDMCVILVRYASTFGIALSEVSGDVFNDDALISKYARDAVYISRNAGIVTGASGNVFNPKNTASRAEAAAVFMRFMSGYVGW